MKPKPMAGLGNKTYKRHNLGRGGGLRLHACLQSCSLDGGVFAGLGTKGVWLLGDKYWG